METKVREILLKTLKKMYEKMHKSIQKKEISDWIKDLEKKKNNEKK